MFYHNSDGDATPDPSSSSEDTSAGGSSTVAAARVDLTARITVSKAPKKNSWRWGTVETSLDALLTSLTDVQVGKKSAGNVWAPATFAYSQRTAAYALETHLLVLDSDAGHPLPELRSRFEALDWYAFIIPSPSWGSDV